MTVNSVVGGGIRNPDDALVITRRARELGFSTTVGIIHDHSGQLKPLDEQQRTILEEVVGDRQVDVRLRQLQPISEESGERPAERLALSRRSRYLYVCEDGLVHWCSQQRGHPGIPLGALRRRRSPAPVSRGQELRADVHRRLRASGGAGRRVAPEP